MVHFIPRTTNFLLETKRVTYYFQDLRSFVWCVWEHLAGKTNNDPGTVAVLREF